MMVIGAGGLLLGNGAFLLGSESWVYFLGMALLGLGWNAAYVAASFMVSGKCAGGRGGGKVEFLTLTLRHAWY